jgi:hypothetical protein
MVGGVRRYRDAAARRRACRARGSGEVVAREWATGGISNLNPLRDHYFNNDIFVHYVQ